MFRTHTKVHDLASSLITLKTKAFMVPLFLKVLMFRSFEIAQEPIIKIETQQLSFDLHDQEPSYSTEIAHRERYAKMRDPSVEAQSNLLSYTKCGWSTDI
jgi:hypothetical protein